MKNDLLDYSLQISMLITLFNKKLISETEYTKILSKLKQKYKIIN